MSDLLARQNAFDKAHKHTQMMERQLQLTIENFITAVNFESDKYVELREEEMKEELKRSI